MVLITIFLVTLLPLGKVRLSDAAIDSPIPGISNNIFNIMADDEDIVLTKEIVDGKNKTYIGGAIEVTIEIRNDAVDTIYNVSLTTPATNITYMNEEFGTDYEEDWFDIVGIAEKNWTSVLGGQSVSTSYTITPYEEGFFTFAPSNVTYDYNESVSGFSVSEQIKFEVYKEPESVIVEKIVIFDGVESDDARVRLDETFEIKVTISNYFYYDEPLDIIANDSSLDTGFIYDEDDLDHNYTDLEYNNEFSFSYTAKANSSILDAGSYELDACDVEYTFENLTSLAVVSNVVTLELYEPIYNGTEWELRVPLLSIEKYFVYENEELEITQYLTELTVFNHTNQPIEIFINVTNTGVVAAFDIVLHEQRYRDFVFETDDLQDWTINRLEQNENANFSYFVTPIILGTFKFEATNVSYSYQNQKTLLNETENYIFSNIIELVVDYEVIAPSFAQQWWAVIGISFGVVALAGIPLAITFMSYRRRKKTQKGT